MALNFDTLKAILSENKAYLNQDGTINNVELHKLAQKSDNTLVDMLVAHDETRPEFFLKRGSYHVFLQDKFIDYISHKDFLMNSYTKYKNKIGLHDGKDFIQKNREVVLSFPFKDCVLEGGQTKDEEKRQEIYYNKVLASEEIDRLLDPKVLTNAKRYSTNQDKVTVKECDTFQRDAEINKQRGTSEDTITDNLIIKGNNLIALHSIKQHFRGKVKLVYIDPPYNTDSDVDTFKYNNSFKHSTWLVFMKNRLEVAKELLRNDGLIIIDIDHFELFYLGTLCDEIFGRENRLGILAVQHNPGGRDNEFFANSHENKLVYAKNKELAQIYNFISSEEELNKKYNKKDAQGRYKERGLQRVGDGSNREESPKLFYPIFYNPENNTIAFEQQEGYVEILPIDSDGLEKRWRWSKQKVITEWDKHNVFVRNVKGKYQIYTKKRIEEDTGIKPKTLWVNSKHAGTNGTKALKELFSKKVFSYPKSPFMVADTLQVATQPNDIVLDYHLGSGTTAAVAHKMGRQYIGIEQMDYIEDIAVTRLQKVLEGEQSGISKAVRWHGGGGG